MVQTYNLYIYDKVILCILLTDRVCPFFKKMGDIYCTKLIYLFIYLSNLRKIINF